MIDTLAIIIFFIGLTVGFVYTALVLFALWRRSWRRAAWLAVQGIVLGVALAYGFQGVMAWARQDGERRVFGGPAEFDEVVFRYTPPAGFKGDASGWRVFALPSALRESFVADEARRMADFPELPARRQDWQVVRWQRTPLDAASRDQVDYVLGGAPPMDEAQVAATAAAVREALARPGAYYALRSLTRDGALRCVEMFVIDPVGGRVYLISRYS